MILHLRPAIVFIGFFTLLLGLAYPLAMTGMGQTLFPRQAGGSLIERDGQIVGSTLIGQEFTAAKYLHARPSATEPAYNGEASSGSNLGPSSAALLDQVTARAEAFGALPVPSEMATASGSGLDPHITLRAAILQVARIAQARDIPESQVIAAIRKATTGAAFGFVGDRIVNVVQVNLALDALEG